MTTPDTFRIDFTAHHHIVGRFEWHRAALASRIAGWRQRRRYRSDLSRLLRVGTHMLRDIGLTQEQARFEIRKPFWKS